MPPFGILDICEFVAGISDLIPLGALTVSQLSFSLLRNVVSVHTRIAAVEFTRSSVHRRRLILLRHERLRIQLFLGSTVRLQRIIVLNLHLFWLILVHGSLSLFIFSEFVIDPPIFGHVAWSFTHSRPG